MIASLVTVLGLTALFGLGGPIVARRVDPALATRILVPAILLTAAASTFALSVAAFTLIGQFPEIAELGPWSPSRLRADTPVPTVAAVAGGLLLTYTAISAVVLLSRRSIALVDVHRTCGRLGAPGSLVVLESDTPKAFTTPEMTGRIIVTRGMLAALTPPERDAMLAHEASHLRHRHSWWLLMADLAAAINPTLRATAGALRHTVERWADEDAAAVTGDRRTVAHAIAQAALAANAYRNHPEHVTAATGGDVLGRVKALLTPRRRRQRPAMAAVALSMLLLAATADATLHVQRQGEALFEHVMARPTHAAAIRHDAVAPMRAEASRR